MDLAAILARLAAITARFTAINDGANTRAEGERDLNDAEQTEWLALEDEQRGLGEQRETLERAQRVADSRAKFESLQVKADTRGDDPSDGITYRSTLAMSDASLIDKARRMLDDGRENTKPLELMHAAEPTRWDPAASKAKVEHLLTQGRSKNWNPEYFARMLLLTESPQYRSAWQKLLSGAPYFTEQEGRALAEVSEMRAALNITTDAQGGYAVPVLIDPSVIWTAQGHPNDWLQISRVENITTDEWKGVTSAGATAYWTTEGVKSTDGAPTLVQPVVTTKKLSVYIPYSVEVGGDWPGFAAEMSTAIDMVWNEELVMKFTNGTGLTAQPNGLIAEMKKAANAAQHVVSADTGSANATDVYAMWARLLIRYRRGARWMSNTAIENAVRQQATTDPNFARNNLSADGLETLMKRPYHENDYMDAVVASTSSSIPLVLGDFRNFLIAMRVGMNVENIMHVIDTTSGTPTGQRALYGWGRVGSNVINTAGFVILSQQ